MKRYRVELTYSGTMVHTVEAENEDDAIDIAATKQMPMVTILGAVLDNEVQVGVTELKDGEL